MEGSEYEQIKNLFLCLAFIFVFCSLSFAQSDETITITTYYPSPYGVYKILRLYPDSEPKPGNNCENEGEMAYYQDAADFNKNKLVVCKRVTTGSAPGSLKWSEALEATQGSLNGYCEEYRTVSSAYACVPPGGSELERCYLYSLPKCQKVSSPAKCKNYPGAPGYGTCDCENGFAVKLTGQFTDSPYPVSWTHYYSCIKE